MANGVVHIFSDLNVIQTQCSVLTISDVISPRSVTLQNHHLRCNGRILDFVTRSSVTLNIIFKVLKQPILLSKLQYSFTF